MLSSKLRNDTIGPREWLPSSAATTSARPTTRPLAPAARFTAREFLGTQDPLDFFLAWKTPVERYQPQYEGLGAGEDDDADPY